MAGDAALARRQGQGGAVVARGVRGDDARTRSSTRCRGPGRFELQQRTRDAAPIIRRLRHEAEHTRQHTVEQARRMLAAGRSQDEVQKLTDRTITEIDKLVQGKEAEVMAV